MGRDVAAVLDAVAPTTPAVVVGHSLGGIAAIAMAEQRPELFGLAGRGADPGREPPPTICSRGAMGSLTGLLRRSPATLSSVMGRVDGLRKAVMARPGDIRAAAVRLTQFGPDAPAHLVDHVVHLAQRASSELWTDGLAELLEIDLQHALPRAKVPALVIVGEYDRVTPPASAIRLVDELPDARLVVMAGTGHMPMLERPVELDREIRLFATSVLKPVAGWPAGSRRRKRAGA